MGNDKLPIVGLKSECFSEVWSSRATTQKSKHAKVFWQRAVSVGLAMAIFQLFQGRIWAAAISGVAGGIVAGGGLAWLSYLGERKLAKQDIRTVNMDHVQERAVEVQY